MAKQTVACCKCGKQLTSVLKGGKWYINGKCIKGMTSAQLRALCPC